MRGTRKQPTMRNLTFRFIPAHAGNTNPFHQYADAITGSSPLMRGTPRLRYPNMRLQRFIPAHAGNTITNRVGFAPISVHPRSCGEHITPSSAATSTVGSSPLMRGTLTRPVNQLYLYRFIPAHAGNTCPALETLCITAVHPRSCGEHPPISKYVGFSFGSSPLMRGTPNLIEGQLEAYRFIPAHAGNTSLITGSRPA